LSKNISLIKKAFASLQRLFQKFHNMNTIDFDAIMSQCGYKKDGLDYSKKWFNRFVVRVEHTPDFGEIRISIQVKPQNFFLPTMLTTLLNLKNDLHQINNFLNHA
jgi:hypothetical protein